MEKKLWKEFARECWSFVLTSSDDNQQQWGNDKEWGWILDCSLEFLFTYIVNVDML